VIRGRGIDLAVTIGRLLIVKSTLNTTKWRQAPVFWLAAASSILVGASPPAYGQTNSDTLTTNQALGLTLNALARRGLAIVADQVVDVSGLPSTGLATDKSESLGEINLWLKPKPSMNGVCEATEIRLAFEPSTPDQDRGPDAPQKLSSLDTATFYKVRGNLDENGDQDDLAFAQTCARDRPERDNYFSAPDSRTAQEAGLIVQSAQNQAKTGRVNFGLTCELPKECRVAAKLIAGISSDQLMMVEEQATCPDDHSCLELTVHTNGACTRSLSVRAIYRGAGPKGWGMVHVERLRLNHEECPSLAL